MQTSRNDCPISLLPEDVLWEVFLVHTYRAPDHHQPLTTARHSSQVCRKWRFIFLSSSTIWGRLLDVDDLARATDDWRKEVVARTRDALLWVYGKVCSYKQHDLFLNLLHHNWKQVEILDIEYWGFKTPSLWAFPKEPAPQLCKFQIVTPYMMPNVLPECLFGDNAPRLIHFRVCNMPYKYLTSASWLPNLTSATFPRTFTPEEVLTALQRMPRLVSVVVHTGKKNKTLCWQGAQVVLPKLRMLEILGALPNACALLERLSPSSDCCLSIQQPYCYLTAGGRFEDHEQYENAIKPYIISYFTQHPPSSVEFRLLANQLDLVLDPDQWGRRFHVVLDVSFLPSSLLMKELASSTSLSHIRTFNLQLLDDGNPFYFQTNIAVISAVEAFSTSVTNLRTNEHALRQLLECPLSVLSTLFPSLITLQFTGPK